jgi:GntR family transcriptional repressor for pyruvate dehydrogenase complex
MFAEIQQSTITQQIIRQIHTAIIAGKLSAGDKLPSENELIKQFGISKQTLRESLRALEHMGLIQTRKGMGGGSFVVEVDASITKLGLLNYFYFKNLSIKDISMIRQLIEPFATQLAVKKMSDKDISILKNLNISAKKHIAANDYDAALADEIAFHTKIADQTDNPLVSLLMEFIEDILVDYKQMFQVGIPDLAVILEAHEKIFTAIQDRDPDRAAQEMLEHVNELEENLAEKEKNLSLKDVYSKTTTYNYNR